MQKGFLCTASLHKDITRLLYDMTWETQWPELGAIEFGI